MKRILFFFIAAIALLPLSGCEQEIHSYTGDRGIYFSVRWGTQWQESRWPYWSYSNVDFVKVPEDTYTAEVKVMITDVAVPYDREFRYQIDKQATTGREGVDYEVPEGIGVIPAGKVEGVATVVLHRTPEMESEVVTVALQLVANENFDLVFTKFIQPKENTGTDLEIEEVLDASRHQLRISDVMVKPDNWLGKFNEFGNYEEHNTFGAFTPKKIRLMFELFDLTYADFMDSQIMTTGYMYTLARRLSIYLTEQYRNGTPVLEEDGRLMWAEGCKWKSYEGVPWDGTINPEYF